jgi:cation diffusion facilitator CzcD-associated flavoprotein CzcO
MRTERGWRVETPTGALDARAVVIATGIAANPRRPVLPGEATFGGDVRHSVAYRRPDAYVGRRVLVVGVGNSGGEIASELAAAGAAVTVSVRSGAHVVPRAVLGVPVQYWSLLMQRLPLALRERVALGVSRLGELRRGPSPLPKPARGPLDGIPLIGFHLVDAIRAGRVDVAGAVAALLPRGARFADGTERPFDAVILATGFAAALQPLGALVTTDARGFARRTDRVASAEQPALCFVGHSYDSAGALHNIRRDAALAAARVSAIVRGA